MHAANRQTHPLPPLAPGLVWAALLAAHLCALPQAAAAARAGLEGQPVAPHQPAGGAAAYAAVALLALVVVAALLALVGIKQDRQQGGHVWLHSKGVLFRSVARNRKMRRSSRCVHACPPHWS